MVNKYYSIPILNSEYFVYLCIGENYKELSDDLMEYFENKFDPSFNPDTFKNVRGRTFGKNNFAPYIFVNLKNCKNKHYFYATLAHEACHAIDEIFNAIGDNNRNELFAHCVAAVIRDYKDFEVDKDKK